MGNVVEFQKEQEHLSGEAHCTRCKHEWVVCHDYGRNRLLHRGARTSKMKKVHWND